MALGSWLISMPPSPSATADDRLGEVSGPMASTIAHAVELPHREGVWHLDDAVDLGGLPVAAADARARRRAPHVAADELVAAARR